MSKKNRFKLDNKNIGISPGTLTYVGDEVKIFRVRVAVFFEKMRYPRKLSSGANNTVIEIYGSLRFKQRLPYKSKGYCKKSSLVCIRWMLKIINSQFSILN